MALPIIFGLLAVFLLIYGKKFGYFCLPQERRLFYFPLSHVIFLFFGYIGANFFLAPFFLKLLQRVPYSFFWTNFLVVLCIGLFLYAYVRYPGKPYVYSIWKNSTHSITQDCFQGFLSWFIAFPIVVFAEHLLEGFCLYFFSYKEVPNQTVVEYLRLTQHHPFFLTVAIATIVIYAPIVEEFLFRGALQTFLVHQLGRKIGIVASSSLFALFHYSPTQGLGNITIVGSLFFFSLFLGFLYERQKSLLSPIILHSTFNVVSMIQLLFFTEGVFYAQTTIFCLPAF
ncbi:MAG: type II CAAX endopeptidase family protein [Chlamydiota bacterium]